jgi:hypothetical protein
MTTAFSSKAVLELWSDDERVSELASFETAFFSTISVGTTFKATTGVELVTPWVSTMVAILLALMC